MAAEKLPFKLFAGSILFVLAVAVRSLYPSRDDPWTFGFGVFSFGTLLALLFCFRLQVKREEAGKRSERLTAVIFALMTVLTACFMLRSAMMMGLELTDGIIWVVVLAFSVGGFYALILYCFPSNSRVSGDKDEEKKKVEEDA